MSFRQRYKINYASYSIVIFCQLKKYIFILQGSWAKMNMRKWLNLKKGPDGFHSDFPVNGMIFIILCLKLIF